MLDRINHALRKLDPTRIPSDPILTPYKPTITLRCFLIGDDTPFLTIIMSPEPGCSRWSEKARLLADHFGCDAEDIDSLDEEVGEFITMRGEIVGSFERPVSADDVAAIGVLAQAVE